MRAAVVGAGPVGCLVAAELTKRGFQVDIYERAPDPRATNARKGHSFNLTLTKRGLRWVDPKVRQELYRLGTRLVQRIIHHADGTISYQPYGTSADHYLLSIPRAALHTLFLDVAEKHAVQIHFEHECLSSNPHDGTLVLNSDGELKGRQVDLIVGCDGANSIIRQQIFRHSDEMTMHRDYIEHGYIELRVPPGPSNSFALMNNATSPKRGNDSQHGLHIWPRGNFMLIAQPNIDHSYTATLFMHRSSKHSEGNLAFDQIMNAKDEADLFATYFPDIAPHLSGIHKGFRSQTVSSLRTVRTSHYHCGRAVLVGDSAHTMVPFYGQGINCSFEDVGELMKLIDEQTRTDQLSHQAIRDIAQTYTQARQPHGDAITDLSLANLHELSDRTDNPIHIERSRLEKELQLGDPEQFMSLYDMVAFSEIPYHEAVLRHEKTKPIIDRIHRESIEQSSNPIVLDADQAYEMIKQIAERIRQHYTDIEQGHFPASYLHGAASDSRKPGAALRMDQAPLQPTALEDLLDEVFDVATHDGMTHSHPGFVAQIPSGGLVQAAAGELIARSLNKFISVNAAAPGMAMLESNVIRWFDQMLGYGPAAFGYLTTGGSLANFMGLRCALESQADDESLAVIYFSTQAHYSVRKSARMAGVQASRMRVVPVHDDLTMNISNLEQMIDKDIHEGWKPALVIVTAGTTNTGAIDDLNAAASVCSRKNLQLHVDACFGGFFRLTQRGQTLLSGIEKADSISVDAHKSLFLPHGSSALLVKNRSYLEQAFSIDHAKYIPELDGEAVTDFCNIGPELTRETRGLSAWLPLRMHGVQAFADCLDSRIDLADYLATELSKIDLIEVIPRNNGQLPVVAFRPEMLAGTNRDDKTIELCRHLCMEGNIYIATTSLPYVSNDQTCADAGLAVRACILHPRTDRTTIDQIVESAHSFVNTRTEALEFHLADRCGR